MKTQKQTTAAEPICLLLPFSTDHGQAFFGRCDRDIPEGSLIAVSIGSDLRPWMALVDESGNRDRAMKRLKINVGPPAGCDRIKTAKEPINTSELSALLNQFIQFV